MRISFVAILFTAMHSLSSIAFNEGFHMEPKYPPPQVNEAEAFNTELNFELMRWYEEYEKHRRYVNQQTWFKDGKSQVEAGLDHKAHWEWVKQQIYGETERE